jgi:sugar lactone lactonase YvrE
LNGDLVFLFEKGDEMKKINLFLICFTIILILPLAVNAIPLVPPGYTIEIYASGIPTPMGLAFDSLGNLFFVDGSNSVYKITPDGQVSEFGSGIPNAEGVAIDSSDNIFISGNGRITKITQSGAATIFALGFSNLNGIVVDNLDNLYVADLGAGKIFKVTQDGSASLFSSAVQKPSDVVFNPGGELFVSDVGLESILKVSPNGDVTTYYPLVGVPAFHPLGYLYLANPTLASIGEILRISPEGVLSTFAIGFQHPRGLVFDSSKNLFVSDKYAGIIYKISANIEVIIDIKPGSDTNCLNINGHGVIPVAILGSADFDVTNINIDTLLFNGSEVQIRGKKEKTMCHYEDMSGDFTYSEGAPDGHLDLVCQFEDDPSQWVPGQAEATLTGELIDGTSIEGTDTICIVP